MRAKDTIGISWDLKILQHELSQAMEAALARLHLSLPQYTALSCLEEKKGATNADLARKSSVTPQTMNRIMHNLKRDGFVTCEQNEEHGLKQDYKLTAKAERVICQAHTVVNEVELQVIKGLSKAGLKSFREMLGEMRENLKS
jgi:DNA-binding MarR family transcriptional regulator